MTFLVARIQHLASNVSVKAADVLLALCDSLDKRLYSDWDLELTGAELLAAYEENVECFEPDDIWHAENEAMRRVIDSRGFDWGPLLSDLEALRSSPVSVEQAAAGDRPPGVDESPPCPPGGHLTTDWVEYIQPAICEVLSEHMPEHQGDYWFCMCGSPMTTTTWEWREHVARILAAHLAAAFGPNRVKLEVNGPAVTLCPVCRQPVAVSKERHIVFAHHDKAMRPCPMGGNPLGGDS